MLGLDYGSDSDDEGQAAAEKKEPVKEEPARGKKRKLFNPLAGGGQDDEDSEEDSEDEKPAPRLSNPLTSTAQNTPKPAAGALQFVPPQLRKGGGSNVVTEDQFHLGRSKS